MNPLSFNSKLLKYNQFTCPAGDLPPPQVRRGPGQVDTIAEFTELSQQK
jgi:hypothetical protein